MNLLGVTLHYILFLRGIKFPSVVSLFTDCAFLFVQILMTLKAEIKRSCFFYYEKNRLALNTWTGIFDIVNCILFAISQNVIWVTVFSDASTGEYGKVIAIRIFFYAMAWIGISLNIWALIQSEKHGISLVGSILGIIGNALFNFTLFFPTPVILIVAAVFIMLQKPVNNTTAQDTSVQVTKNITKDPKKQDK